MRMGQKYIWGAYILSGGWLPLTFTLIAVLDELQSWGLFNSILTLYLVVAVIGVCAVAHYIIFDFLPRRIYVIFGCLCWLSSYGIFAMSVY